MMPGTIDEPAEKPRLTTEPMVACVMLVDGRPDMVKRAVASFRSQTYARKRLLMYDSGAKPIADVLPEIPTTPADEIEYWRAIPGPRSIGALRNEANRHTGADAIAHWDSDDWSHPARLAVQVAALLVSGAEAVGFAEALFWHHTDVHRRNMSPGCAWVFRCANPAFPIGGSLLYWKAVWEKNPFPDKMTAEDTLWQMRRKIYGMSGVNVGAARMVCHVHGANTSSKIEPGRKEWRRAPEWDGYCRDAMRL